MEKKLNVQDLNACELDDEQLDQVSGGIDISTLNGKPTGLKLGQALEKPSCFTKSDDRYPSNNGF